MGRVLRYYSGNRQHQVEVQGVFEGRQQYGGGRSRVSGQAATASASSSRSGHKRLVPRS